MNKYTYYSKAVEVKRALGQRVPAITIAILKSNGNTVASQTHKVTPSKVESFENGDMGADELGVKGWILDPADHYSGYADHYSGYAEKDPDFWPF